MTEATLKGQLVQELNRVLPNCVVLRHEDIFRAGIPDISVTWNLKVTWLEVKYANPKVRSSKLQKYTALRLAAAGACWFVVYGEKNELRGTYICHPRNIDDLTRCEDVRAGFNHVFVAEFVRSRMS